MHKMRILIIVFSVALVTAATTAGVVAARAGHAHGGVSHTPSGKRPKGDPFRVVWTRKQFTYGNTGETRAILIENLGAAAAVPAALHVVSVPGNGITIPAAQATACRTMNYAANGNVGDTCEMTATYSRASPRNQPPYKLTVWVLPGACPRNLAILRG
jgi:archaellum component FlaG (FlaF/FlaG flagellin family)